MVAIIILTTFAKGQKTAQVLYFGGTCDKTKRHNYLKRKFYHDNYMLAMDLEKKQNETFLSLRYNYKM